jgi:hypothetical protein
VSGSGFGAAPLGDVAPVADSGFFVSPPLAVAPLAASGFSGFDSAFVSLEVPLLAAAPAVAGGVVAGAVAAGGVVAGGVAAGAVAPPEAELDAEPDGDDGDVLGEGEVVELELEEPGVDEAFLSPLSHAARPKASATAAAKIESFMCPPWLGYETKQQGARPA